MLACVSPVWPEVSPCLALVGLLVLVELNVPVVETDREEGQEEGAGEKEADSCLVVVHQTVTVVTVVSVPAPVQHQHAK